MAFTGGNEFFPANRLNKDQFHGAVNAIKHTQKLTEVFGNQPEATFRAMDNERPNFWKEQRDLRPYDNGFIDAGRGFWQAPANKQGRQHIQSPPSEERPNIQGSGYNTIPHEARGTHILKQPKAPREWNPQLVTTLV